MTIDLNIRINRPGGWLDEFFDDSMLYLSGLYDLHNFMMYPTSLAIDYFNRRGWTFYSSTSDNEIWFSNFAVNKMIKIKSYRMSNADCWRVDEIFRWDCVEISATTLNLN